MRDRDSEMMFRGEDKNILRGSGRVKIIGKYFQ